MIIQEQFHHVYVLLLMIMLVENIPSCAFYSLYHVIPHVTAPPKNTIAKQLAINFLLGSSELPRSGNLDLIAYHNRALSPTKRLTKTADGRHDVFGFDENCLKSS